MLNITDGSRSLSITKVQANKIELSLNKSKYARVWGHIGNVLYNFSIGKKTGNLIIKPIQFDILSLYIKE
tara:strand:- start:493 stop:702 length:210 start_codon:yes stop_codon:yes gene_type:complete